MKTGRPLDELAKEITRQNDEKHDYLADTSKLELCFNNSFRLDVYLAGGMENFDITPLCH